MKILIINPILYTSESAAIPKRDSIKDVMIYDLCLAFHEAGHTVELLAGEPWKPVKEEAYPFRVIWEKCSLQRVFLPHRLPFIARTGSIVKSGNYDLIITSEVFSINTFLAFRNAPDRVIAWHELSKHNAMFHKIPSMLWYNVFVRLFMRNLTVVARSEQARAFISAYCRNTVDTVIDHGVNLDKFPVSREKKSQFAVCSQLIPRKRIDGILQIFGQYLREKDSGAKLVIIGGGPEEQALRLQAQSLGIADRVAFTGYLKHEEMTPLLASSWALLVNTEQDLNMVSIVEAIACGIPIVTTTIPLSSAYILRERLGIAKESWGVEDLAEIVNRNAFYVENCLRYRDSLSTKKRVEQFIGLLK